MFYIMSEADIQFFQKRKDTFVIRINDREGSNRPLPFLAEQELSLCFHDISLQAIQHSGGCLPDNWEVFSYEMAEQVHRFFQQMKQQSDYDFIIHCYAGFSRSSAIALAYSWFLNNPAMEQFLMNQHYTPNTLVLQRMNEVMNTGKQGLVDHYSIIK